MAVKALYVHIPFCDHICHYCDFCKVFYDEKVANQYLDCLENEFKQLSINEFETIYIGGGTPSSLNEKQLVRLMNIFKPYLNSVKEYSIELNPETMNIKKLSILKDGGITRLSIGVQTFNDQLLPYIGRVHCCQDVYDLINQAKQLGFKNISVDLMYGLPHQTIDDVKNDLLTIKSLDIQHLSYYSLILEDHTVLKIKDFQPIDEEIEYQMNQLIDQTLKEMNFKKYEVSNYAKDGYQCLHNLKYWHYENYEGIGIGACGKVDNQMKEHSRSLSHYLKGQSILKIETLSKEDHMFNHLMMSLRLVEGLNIDVFNQRYQVNFIEYYQEPLNKHIKMKHLFLNHHYLKVNPDYFYLLNAILVDFI